MDGGRDREACFAGNYFGESRSLELNDVYISRSEMSEILKMFLIKSERSEGEFTISLLTRPQRMLRYVLSPFLFKNQNSYSPEKS